MSEQRRAARDVAPGAAPADPAQRDHVRAFLPTGWVALSSPQRLVNGAITCVNWYGACATPEQSSDPGVPGQLPLSRPTAQNESSPIPCAVAQWVMSRAAASEKTSRGPVSPPEP